MKITGRTMLLSKFGIDTTIEKYKEYGFEGLEFCFCGRDFSFNYDSIQEFYAQHVLEKCSKLDIPIYSTSFHCDFVFNDTKFEELKKAIEATRLYGASTCITSNGARRLDLLQEGWDILVNRTKELVKIAEDNAVDLAIEFEPGMVCGTTADVVKLIEVVGSKHLKANLDLGHVFLCDPEPLGAILSLKDHIAHAHIENMQRGVHRHLVPQVGDMDIAEYMQALKNTGFDGAVALDLYQDDFEKVCKSSAEFLKNIVLNLK